MHLTKLILVVVALAIGLAAGTRHCPDGIPKKYCSHHGEPAWRTTVSSAAVVITPAPTATTHAPLAVRDYTTDGVVIQKPVGWIDKACAFDGMEKDVSTKNLTTPPLTSNNPSTDSQKQDAARHDCVKECLHLYSERKCLNSRCALSPNGVEPGQCFCTCAERVKNPPKML